MKMKKNYFEPAAELIDLEMKALILAGSDILDGIDSGNSDGGVGGSDKEASSTDEPGWMEGL